MKKAAAADVKAKFATFLSESNNGPVVITRDGKPIAVLMGVHDEDELDRLIFASSRLAELRMMRINSSRFDKAMR